MGKEKRGQMKLSFGMIFSIILIIIFLSFSFWAIMKFLDLQKSAQAGKFRNDFQQDVDDMWKSSQGSQREEYNLPSEVNMICFADFSGQAKGQNADIFENSKQVFFGSENFFFYPIGSGQGLDSTEVDHINLEKVTSEENPFCINAVEGKVSLTIKKGFGDALVTIER